MKFSHWETYSCYHHIQTWYIHIECKSNQWYFLCSNLGHQSHILKRNSIFRTVYIWNSVQIKLPKLFRSSSQNPSPCLNSGCGHLSRLLAHWTSTSDSNWYFDNTEGKKKYFSQHLIWMNILSFIISVLTVDQNSNEDNQNYIDKSQSPFDVLLRIRNSFTFFWIELRLL